jgi:hypothetical protein
MTFDPNYGHFQGADGKARGFAPAQGVSSGYDAGTLMDDLQYHFKFDTATGLLTDSVTSTVLSGTNSPTTETGMVGQAVGFNDSDESRANSTDSDLLTAADEVPSATEGLNVAYPFTLITWIYPQQRTGFSTTAFVIREERFRAPNWALSAYDVTSAVSCNFNFAVRGNGSYFRTASTTTGYAMDAWHCVVCQWYGCNTDENGSYQLYECAKRISVVTGAAGSGSITETQFLTCCGEHLLQGTELLLSIAPSYDFEGRLDLSTRWNRILTEAEILQFYNRSKGGLPPI